MATHTLVVDPGTGSIKVGLPTETVPSTFPTVVGIPIRRAKPLLLRAKPSAVEEGDPLAGKTFVVCDEALHNLSRVTLSHPMEHGIVKKWDEMEHILNHIFEDTALTAAETAIVLTRPLFNAKADAERWASTLFETFGVPAVGAVTQGLCALYASGRTTGIVLDSGEGITQVTPVFDSYPIMSAANRINVGGRQVSDHLRRILAERGYNFTTSAEQLLVQGIKERHCMVVPDYAHALAEPEVDVDAELPDGETLRIGKERFRAAEILFSPTLVQSEMPSVGEFIANAIKKCGMDTRRQLLSNIALSGGNTLFPGFENRLEQDVVKRFPGLFGSIKVLGGKDRGFAVWSGAAVLAGLSTYKSDMISRADYDEYGPEIIHGKKREAADDDDDGPPPDE